MKAPFIWLTGAAGMLGSELGKAFDAAGLNWVGSGREVDISDPQALERFAARIEAENGPPSWIVNCAAWTAVDLAEKDPRACWKVNSEGPRNLALLAVRRNARLLHFSTDYVFDGLSKKAYLETDTTSPLSVYGKSKVAGEEAVTAASDSHLIVRTSWLYGGKGPSFVHTMLRLLQEKEELGVVADHWGSPTWTGALADAVLKLLSNPPREGGIYHCTGSGKTNWYDFAREIQKLGRETGLLTRDCQTKPLTTAQYPLPAPRPARSVLSNKKWIQTFETALPQWEESLPFFLKTLRDSHPRGRDRA